MEAAATVYQNGGDGGRVLLVVEVRSNSSGDGASDGSGKVVGQRWQLSTLVGSFTAGRSNLPGW